MTLFRKREDENISAVPGRSSIRLINQQSIIEKVYSSRGISKAQIAKELGISKPAVTDNVKQLVDLGLIEEREEGQSGKNGGRRPILLYFNEKYSYIGALDLSLQEPVCAISDLQYGLKGIKRVVVSKTSDPEQRRRTISDTFEQLLAEKEIPAEKLGVVVIIQPGVIGTDNNAHYAFRQHHFWTEIGLDVYLQEFFSTQVLVRNDVNTAAIGEMSFGFAQPIKNLIYVSCGAGLGAGIILDGELYPGPRNAAGEIGSFLVSNGQTLEDTSAMSGLIQRAGSLYKEAERPEPTTFGELVFSVKKGDPVVQNLVYEIGRELGVALLNTCAVLDIDTVIVGGDYIQLGDKLFDGIEDVFESGSIFKPLVKSTDLAFMSGVYGSFVIGKDKIIENSLYK